MYTFSYSEVLAETPQAARERERIVLEHSIELLQAAQEKGISSRESVEAIYFIRRLWAFLIEDLAKVGNDLPNALRADLISVGLWIMNEAEKVRLGVSSNFKGLIDVSRMVAVGLK
jgi:flagellar biosynthesis activator protein FlaF